MVLQDSNICVPVKHTVNLIRTNTPRLDTPRAQEVIIFRVLNCDLFPDCSDLVIYTKKM